jgi:hypothetical protein
VKLVRESEQYRALSDDGLCAQCPFANVDEGSGCFGRKSAAEYSSCADKACFCAQDKVNSTVNYIVDFVRDKCPGEQTWPSSAVQVVDSFAGYCGLAVIRPREYPSHPKPNGERIISDRADMADFSLSAPIESPLSTPSSASGAPLPTSPTALSAPTTSSTGGGGGGGGPRLSVADISGLVSAIVIIILALAGLWLEHKTRFMRKKFGVQRAAGHRDDPRPDSRRFNVTFNNVSLGQRQEPG